MSKLTLIILAICFVGLCASEGSRPSSSVRNSISKIVPRLLWNFRHGDDNNRNQQRPIVIVQPSQDYDSDRHHHQHYPFYPPYYSPRPPPPPFNYPGSEFANTAGGGPTYVIINPNNMQGINLTTGGNSTRRSLSGPSIFDLLQGLNLGEFTDGFDDDSEVVNAADGDFEFGVNSHHQAHNNDDNQDQDDQDAISDDELSLLERQANRGLSPKHLLSFLMQDKRRRRMQEVLAGIYLRNYNINRK